MKKFDPATPTIGMAPPTNSISFNPEEIITHLDSTLSNIDSLLKKMQETGLMVKKARNQTFKNI